MAVTYALENRVTGLLLSLTGDVERQLDSYSTRMADDGRWIDTFVVRVKGANAATVRNNTNTLTSALRDAQYWVDDQITDDSIWLHWATDGETEKRALIYGFEFEPVERQGISGMALIAQPLSFIRIAITRGPWEQTDSNELSGSSATNINAFGGTWNLTAVTGGDSTMRLERLRLVTAAGAGELVEAWIGFRPPRDGVTSFSPVIECESGTNITDAADVVDANGSGGNAVDVDFATTEGWAYRLRLPMSVIEATNPEHYIGRYHVILRARTTDAALTAATRVVVGFGAPASTKPSTVGPIQYVNGTSYQLYDMGIFSIPLDSYRFEEQTVSDALTNLNISIEALMADGTASTMSVYYDAICLVPAEHSVHIENIAGWGTGGGLVVVTAEDGQIRGYVDDGNSTYTAATYTGVVTPNSTGLFPWGIPYQGGLMVIAAQRSGVSNLADEISDLYYARLYNRYLMYVK